MHGRYARNNPLAPFVRAAPVTPSDSAVIETCDGLSIGTAGALAVTFMDGTTATITLPAGITPLAVTKVAATGTTAAGITALYRNGSF